MKNHPFFSLITGTLNRKHKLNIFLTSLAGQHFKNFELILVDQNHDLDVTELVNSYKDIIKIKHIKTSLKGLSRARNLGFKCAIGAWVAFPDDDCEYPSDTLQKIYDIAITKKDITGISTLVLDRAENFSAGGYMAAKTQLVTRQNVWRTAVSPSLFLKSDMCKKIKFDERLGVGGNDFGSGEETDFVLSLIEDYSCKILYVPQVIIWHPAFKEAWSYKVQQRGFSYGCGMGAVLKKHHFSLLYVFWFALLQFVRFWQNLCRFNFGKALFHWEMCKGRIAGFFLWKLDE
ncbi:MAG: glycosyltransferase family 2 protein [Lentisphaerae bacterium]|nr:glycosyltransferase family 2 protein [Lentisphaerota bacterium]MCP4102637.1 glycosyltransferase family 2 protein [Lentisphaerota bacterium]